MPVLSLVRTLALATSLVKVLTVERSYKPKLVMGLELRGTPPYIEPDVVASTYVFFGGAQCSKKKILNSVDLNG
jgi:hypothetical protein